VKIDSSTFSLDHEIRGESAEETALLRGMLVDARKYIQSYSWCPRIGSVRYAGGVGGIVAVFYVDLERPINRLDKALWVIVGDLPSAYLVVIPSDGVAKALSRYCVLMEDWCGAVLAGSGLAAVFPVEADPTFDNARALQKRIAFLRSEILPRMDSTNSPTAQ
jgi:hypothetical protein